MPVAIRDILSFAAIGFSAASWALLAAGTAYCTLVLAKLPPRPLSIYLPGAFENLLIFFGGSVFAGVGLVLGIVALRTGTKTKVAVVAVILGGLYVAAVAGVLLLQVSRSKF